MASSENESLKYTGERMVPEKCGVDTFWEHIYSYQFAARFAQGKDVLDVACGEAYGTAALKAAGAKSVVGIDIDQASCDHARSRYGVDARMGSIESLPLAENSFDVVVCFETIEHVPNTVLAMSELKRVLRANGLVVISTPNRDVYSPGRKNPFHCCEMNLTEFRQLLSNNFPRFELFCQQPTRANLSRPSTYLALPGLSGRFVRAIGRVFNPWLCPGFSRIPTPEARRASSGLISRPVRTGASFTNRYVVRRASFKGSEHPVYYVAVAKRL